MSYDFSNTPAIRVEIHYDGELLYNSAEKLYRQYILLDASGAERTPHCGTIYLFASNLQEVTFPMIQTEYIATHIRGNCIA